MLFAALALVAANAVTMMIGGRFRASFDGQPIAHADGLWNFAAMLLVGLTAALAGGCPVRQMVMAGEGNGDALLALVGLVVGAAAAHNMGLVSSQAGPTAGGKIAVIVGILYAAVYAAGITRARAASP
jgi:YedE family putative selenium metabolism protein